MSESRVPISQDNIRGFWNRWNARYRENHPIGGSSARRGAEVIRILRSLGSQSLNILEVACGTGWLAVRLAEFGNVTAVDIADETISHAQKAYPNIRFLAGDITEMDLDGQTFDVVVNLETIGNVPDRRAFADALTRFLKPGGYLILTAQNKYVYERRADIPPPEPGQIRNWINRRICRKLFEKDYHICYIRTVMLAGHKGMLHYVNSYRLNAIADRLGIRDGLDRFRERIGLGQSLVMLARRK